MKIFSFLLLAVLLIGCGGMGEGEGEGDGENLNHSISGQVTLNGTGLSGVTMALGGYSSATTTTDASGNYTFTDLFNTGYTITPSRIGFAFSPTSSWQSVFRANITGVNFTATPAPFSISGQVTLNGTGLSGVTMALSGNGSATTTTDASGNYTFTSILNGPYIITPSRIGFSFSPTSSQQTVSGVNITGVNFTAIPGQIAHIVPCPPSGWINFTIQDNVFWPVNSTIFPGIVKWTNNGPSLHTVTSGTSPNPDGIFDSSNLGTGATVCVEFLGTGTYEFFCTIHPTMTGSVTVRP